MSVKGFIVRFDGDEAIVELANGEHISIQSALLPLNTQQGDYVIENAKDGTYHVDVFISEEHRKDILRMSDRYFE
ncbi:MAG: hypothetical protein ACOX2M_06760 [Fastidiosipilaceae bacterium]